MKLKQSVKLLLIALFVWASQSTTIHFQHHDHKEVSECNVCDASQKMKLYQHNTPVVVSNENLAVRIKREVETIVVNERFDYTVVPQPKYIKTIDNRQYCMVSRSVGFNATAPPAHFS
jgi:hypothetical protein